MMLIISTSTTDWTARAKLRGCNPGSPMRWRSADAAVSSSVHGNTQERMRTSTADVPASSRKA